MMISVPLMILIDDIVHVAIQADGKTDIELDKAGSRETM
jgi:hypothetical protein